MPLRKKINKKTKQVPLEAGPPYAHPQFGFGVGPVLAPQCLKKKQKTPQLQYKQNFTAVAVAVQINFFAAQKTLGHIVIIHFLVIALSGGNKDFTAHSFNTGSECDTEGGGGHFQFSKTSQSLFL